MELVYSASAVKALRSLPKAHREGLIRKLEAVAADPFGQHSFAKALKGGGFSIRQGDWRALYYIDHDEQTVTVDDIGNRREVYR